MVSGSVPTAGTVGLGRKRLFLMLAQKQDRVVAHIVQRPPSVKAEWLATKFPLCSV